MLGLLRSTQSVDPNERLQVELEIKKLENTPEFPLQLLEAAGSDAEVPLRQAAILLLQQYVLRHWSILFEQFQGPAPDEQIKNQVRNGLIHLLKSTDNSLLVKALAYTIARIATVDFPDEWPSILPIILEFMDSGNNSLIHSSLDVLNELLNESLMEEQFFAIAPQIATRLFNLLKLDSNIDEVAKTQVRAVTAFGSCLELSEMYQEAKPELIQTFLSELLPPWMELLLLKMQLPLLNPGEQVLSPERAGLFALKGKIASVLKTLRELYPKRLTPYLLHFVEGAWGMLVGVLPVYTIALDGKNNDIEDSQFAPGYESQYLIELLQFISISFQNKAVQQFFQNGASSGNLTCIQTLLQYARLSEHDIEVYEDDVNEYLAIELTFDWINESVRGAAVDVLSSMEEHSSLPIQKFLRETSADLLSKANVDWKLQEALLYACGVVDANSDDSMNEGLDPLFNVLTAHLQGSNDHVLLTSRIVLMLGHFSEVLPSCGQLLNVCIGILTAPNVSILVKFSAIKTVERICSSSSDPSLEQYQTGLVQAIIPFFTEAADEVFILLVECLAAVLKLNYEAILATDIPVISMLFSIVTKSPGDPYVLGVLEDTFEELTSASNNYEQICSVAFPEVGQLLQSDDELLVDVGSALLLSLIRGGPSPLPANFCITVLPILEQMITAHIDDNEVVQLSQETMLQLLKKDAAQVSAAQKDGISGMQIVLSILEKLLCTNLNDSACVSVGAIVVQVIDKAGSSLNMETLLLACINRLSRAEQPRFIQSIIYVFAKLIHRDPEGMVNFLTSMQTANGTALEILMRVWCDNFSVFSGFKNIAFIATALAKVFCVQQPMLDQIQVKGDLLVSQSSRIITRSQSKKHPEQFSAVSAAVKIVQLLAQEYQSLEKKDLAVEEVSDDGADDWEDGTADIDFETLKAFAEDGNAIEEDSNDTEIILDLDLQTYLADFFKQGWAVNAHNFRDIVQQNLNADEKKSLHQFFQ
ncbi:karyopherin Kap14 [Schizosaccharomyces japonicus yFS275]|uniref:Karyopherin Kap14 n=1 Tax=Schizosaccharomyces japonicus (strain yFS275 / FY16936) TaxID=402676 RepID=B6JYW8_SCHJY|nr:karyopherin Kap14 [Schizosaccharomyces japonicus yFS275]EEB06736.1 karyopherin Kap14 [Schizosaccharomyces japonicus yFS275]